MFAYSWDENDDIEQPTTSTWVDAACRDGAGSLTALFFSDEIPDIELAKAICSTCSLVVPCLQGALARREPAGVWVATCLPTVRSLPGSENGDGLPKWLPRYPANKRCGSRARLKVSGVSTRLRN